MKNKTKTRSLLLVSLPLSPFLSYWPLPEIEMAKENEEWECEEETIIHRGLVPPYRNTLVRRFVSIVYLDDRKRKSGTQGVGAGRKGLGRLRVKVASRVQPHRRRNIRHCDRADRTFRSALYRPSALFFLTYPSCSRVAIFPPELRRITHSCSLTVHLLCLRRVLRIHPRLCNASSVKKHRVASRFYLNV